MLVPHLSLTCSTIWNTRLELGRALASGSRELCSVGPELLGTCSESAAVLGPQHPALTRVPMWLPPPGPLNECSITCTHIHMERFLVFSSEVHIF